MWSSYTRLWTVWDSKVSSSVFRLLDQLDWQVHPVSSITREWPAVESPTILVSSILCYLLVICVGRQVQARPKAEPAGSAALKTFIIIHNSCLIFLSAYMCYGCIREAYKGEYKLWGNSYNANETRLAKYLYIFFLSKIYEFLDTFIMLLKGNINQISFLHVYHHATISFIWWMIVRVAPGGDAYFSAALNSWVHVCMYSYYLLAIIIGKDTRNRKTYLWWGKYLTQMQMFQFVLNLAQALFCSRFSPYPKFLSKILLFYMGTLLALFGHFYHSKHISDKQSLKKKQR